MLQLAAPTTAADRGGDVIPASARPIVPIRVQPLQPARSPKLAAAVWPRVKQTRGKSIADKSCAEQGAGMRTRRDLRANGGDSGKR